MLLHASALSIIFIYYKRWYPTPSPTPTPTPTPTWRSTHFPARSRKISGKNCVADDEEEEAEAEENSAKSAWQKQSVLFPLLLSLSAQLPGHPRAVYQQPTSASVRRSREQGGGKRAWHAFINIYDSIKVCIRHSGGRAAAAATPAAKSLSPALVVLVVLCVCVRVCVFVCLCYASCNL